MMDVLTHPAESAEFLSRLHDRDLPAAELSAYRDHASGCRDCRDAEQAFEQALSAYREAPGVPPAADLSARILRKLRAQTPMRRPFGIAFGIDVRWAGIVAAALLVFLIAAPIVLRRPRPSEPAPFAGYIEMTEEDEAAAAPQSTMPSGEELSSAAPAAPPPPPARRQAAGERKRTDAGDVVRKDLAKAEEARPSADAEPGSSDAIGAAGAPRKEPAPAPPDTRENAAAAPMAAAESQSRPSLFAKRASDAPRLLVEPKDDLGDPPAIARGLAADRLAPLRGRTFVLFVEADGRVRQVSEAFTRDELVSQDDGRGAADFQDPSGAAAVLRDLVFAAGDAPRRLLVSVH